MIQARSTIDKFSHAKNKKLRIEKTLHDCYQYFLPPYEGGYSSMASGPNYDSTGMLCLQAFAANLKHQLMPPWRKWCQIVLTNQQMQRLQRLQPDLDPIEVNREIAAKVTEPFFDCLNHSNFNSEMGQAMLELGIGTGALLINEGSAEDPLQFSAVPLRELILEESAQGQIEDVYRERHIERSKIKQLWPLADWPEDAAEGYITLLEATFFNPKTRGYRYQVIDLSSQELLFETEFAVSPWVVFRWSKVAGEVYGRGPAMFCLSDAKEASKIKELSAQNAALNLLPAYLVANDGIINPQLLEIRPGALIPVRTLATNPIAPLPRGSDFNLGQLSLQSSQNIIKSTLFVDQLGQIDQTPVRTATEVQIRTQEMARLLGAAFGRLQTELLEKLVKRCLYILKKKGIVYPIKIDGKEATLRITSPLIQSQEQEDLAALEQVLPFYQRFPEEFRYSIKTEDIPAFVAKKSAVPAELIRTEKEKAQLASILANTASKNTPPLRK